MVQSIKNTDPLIDPEHGHLLTKAIIDTIHEPLIVLDEDLRVIAASESFYKIFALDFATTHGLMFYDLGNRQWDIPALRTLLEEVIPQQKTVKNYEVSANFVNLGQRAMLINAQEIRYANDRRKMLISIFDVTHQRKLEREKEQLSKQKDILLKEMRHRIANSLQIIASVLLLKAQTVTSQETRDQLEDVHDRIMSIATVQGHLNPSELGIEVDIPSYLNDLCRSLGKSMISDRRPISIEVLANAGKATTDEAIGIGLITTELVINALKHAFKTNEVGKITVSYEKSGEDWKLAVEDDGQGMSDVAMADRSGLGSGIIDTLTRQLAAVGEITSTPKGTRVLITHTHTHTQQDIDNFEMDQ